MVFESSGAVFLNNSRQKENGVDMPMKT